MACVRASFCRSAMLLTAESENDEPSPPSAVSFSEGSAATFAAARPSPASSSSSSSCSCVIAINPYSAHTFPNDSIKPVKYKMSPWFNINSGPMARNSASPRRTLTKYNPGNPRKPLAATVCPTAGDHPSTRAPTSKSSSSSRDSFGSPPMRPEPRGNRNGEATSTYAMPANATGTPYTPRSNKPIDTALVPSCVRTQSVTMP
mmetsp:Transcript_6146/g.22165  ORF Transcript_6146/g.22165 Transcript_6146/m.22165 type:complete len:203 (-) Transcript_6146:553-1161(-)